MLSGLTATVLRVLGLGLLLSAVSEVWFYPVRLSAHVIELCLFYGPLAYLAWLTMAQTRVRTWAGAFWGACLFGFFIEGIPVPVLYSAVPFTILWTSIAWHAIISAALGLWLFRGLCARKGGLAQLMGCTLAGVYLGAWSVELWSLNEQTAAWVWTPTIDVAVQFAVGWAMFVVGHVALDLASRLTCVPLRFEWAIFAILISLLFAAGLGIAFFPLSLLLPALAVLAYWLMHLDGRTGTSPASPFLVRLSNLRVPLGGYAASALIPIVATGVYHLLAAGDIQLESSAIHIMWAGPVSIGLVIWSAVHIWRNRRPKTTH